MTRSVVLGRHLIKSLRAVNVYKPLVHLHKIKEGTGQLL